jgi:hypothetical protein
MEENVQTHNAAYNQQKLFNKTGGLKFATEAELE